MVAMSGGYCCCTCYGDLTIDHRCQRCLVVNVIIIKRKMKPIGKAIRRFYSHALTHVRLDWICGAVQYPFMASVWWRTFAAFISMNNFSLFHPFTFYLLSLSSAIYFRILMKICDFLSSFVPSSWIYLGWVCVSTRFVQSIRRKQWKCEWIAS